MATSAPLRFFFAALMLGLAVAFTVPANAQQPKSVNPREQSVNEQQLLKELQKTPGPQLAARCQRTGVFEQPEGRNWRQFQQVTLRWIGMIAILGMLATAAAVLPDPRHGAASKRDGPGARWCASMPSSVSCTG